jgi:WD40 repeat protein
VNTSQQLAGCISVLGTLVITFSATAQTPDIQSTDPRLVTAHEVKRHRDLYGDLLPPGAIIRCGTTRLRQTDSYHVSCVRFSPDGKILASAGVQGIIEGGDEKPQAIRLWDVASGREIRRMAGSAIDSIAFSPDGNVLAAGNQRAARLFSVATGKAIMKLDGPASAVAFSADGKLLAAADGSLRAWDTSQKKVVLFMKREDRYVDCVVFRPDSNTVVYGTRQKTIHFHNVRDDKEVLKLTGHDDSVYALAMSANGKLLASSSTDWTVRIWDCATGQQLHKIQLPGKDEAAYSVAFSPDGKLLAAGCTDTNIYVWRTTTAELVTRLECHASGVTSVAFSPDGKTLASGDENTTIALWDVATWTERLSRAAHRGQIEAMAFSPDGRTLVSGGRDGTIRFWQAATGKQMRLIRLPSRDLRCLAYAPDGRSVASGHEDKSIRFWDPATGAELRQFRGHADSVCSVNFSPDGSLLVSGSKDHAIRVWDVASGKEISRAPGKGKKNSGTSGTFSPDGKVLACAYEQPSIELRHWPANTSIRQLHGGKDNRASEIKFSADGKIVGASGPDGSLYLWDIANGRELPQFTRHLLFGGQHFAFAPDSRIVATVGSYLPPRLWEVATGDELRFYEDDFDGCWDRASAVAFSPDGKTLAVAGGGDYAILIFDATGILENGELPRANLSGEALQSLWNQLAGSDARAAHRATWMLTAGKKQTRSFLKERLQPVPNVDNERVVRLIKDLDSARFGTRDQATSELKRFRELAEPELRKALAAGSSLEARRRIEELLESVAPMSPERLRVLRAVTVLERLAPTDAEATALLKRLASGAPEAWITEEARGALTRLERQLRASAAKP